MYVWVGLYIKNEHGAGVGDPFGCDKYDAYADDI